MEQLAERMRALKRAVFAFCATTYKPNLAFFKVMDCCQCDIRSLRGSQPLPHVDIYDN